MGGKFLANMRRVSKNPELTMDEARDLKAKIEKDGQASSDKKDKIAVTYKASLENFDTAAKAENIIVQKLEAQKSLEKPNKEIIASLNTELKEATKESVALNKALDKAKKAYDDSVAE